MIKALTENPKLRFKNDINSFVQISEKDGSVIWTDKDGSNVGSYMDRFILYSNGPQCDNLHIEWELVREPVPWQEAIQSLLAGKDIEVELDGVIYRMSANDSDLALHKNIYKKGKWFIK